jgi:hypothetical protein
MSKADTTERGLVKALSERDLLNEQVLGIAE